MGRLRQNMSDKSAGFPLAEISNHQAIQSIHAREKNHVVDLLQRTMRMMKFKRKEKVTVSMSMDIHNI
jgi:hypothetical protein